MRHLHVIGIGAGDPDHLSVEAVAVLQSVDAFLVIDKGAATDELADVRRQIVARHRPDGGFRWVVIAEAERDRSPADYSGEVRSWHAERAARIGNALRDELGPDEVGAILVWGDPSLYDSTLRMLDAIAERGTVPFTRSVTAGVTSISALAAAHQIPLHRIGESMLITTGRRLTEPDGWPASIANAIVMLDADCSFRHLLGHSASEQLEIWWGAYLGMPGQLLVSGRLAEVADEIVRVRAAAKAEHGWIMDVYLLRRPAPAAS